MLPSSRASQGSGSGSQIALPYAERAQITQEYPPPIPPRRQASGVIDTRRAHRSQVDVVREELRHGDTLYIQRSEVDRALAQLRAEEDTLAPYEEIELDPPEIPLAVGTGPTQVEGHAPTPVKEMAPRRRQFPQVHPSLRQTLDSEPDSELDVPAFLRRGHEA
jgi:hypothetical protein